MHIQNITYLSDDSGRWFCKNEAWEFPEGMRWDNKSHNKRVSLATNNEGQHEVLYRTKKSNWILMKWSNKLEGPQGYSFIPVQEAVSWLLRNGYTPGEQGRFAMEAFEV